MSFNIYPNRDAKRSFGFDLSKYMKIGQGNEAISRPNGLVVEGRTIAVNKRVKKRKDISIKIICESGGAISPGLRTLLNAYTLTLVVIINSYYSTSPPANFF